MQSTGVAIIITVLPSSQGGLQMWPHQHWTFERIYIVRTARENSKNTDLNYTSRVGTLTCTCDVLFLLLETKQRLDSLSQINTGRYKRYYYKKEYFVMHLILLGYGICQLRGTRVCKGCEVLKICRSNKK